MDTLKISELYAEGHLLEGYFGTKPHVEVTHTCRGGSVAGVSPDDFVARLTGPATVDGDVSYVSNGRYVVEYMTPRTGTYTLDVKLAHP